MIFLRCPQPARAFDRSKILTKDNCPSSPSTRMNVFQQPTCLSCVLTGVPMILMGNREGGLDRLFHPLKGETTMSLRATVRGWLIAGSIALSIGALSVAPAHAGILISVNIAPPVLP